MSFKNQFQGFLTPLCNMTMDDGREIFFLLRDNINMEQVQTEVSLV
jgi:hypothetical protein